MCNMTAMVGVVIAAHGRLAEELLRTAEGVMGPLEGVRPVQVVATQPDARAVLAEAIRSVDQGEGVLLLADLLGGSPCNLCLSLMADHDVEVVTGVNLPMVLKAASVRRSSKPLREMAADLAGAAQGAIRHASELLRGRM